MRLWFKKKFGLYRLKHYGTCPLCQSSPPRPECYVCKGNRKYGPNIVDRDKDIWRGRFIQWLSLEETK